MPKLGRNDLCHCGSGKKYKICCLDVDKDICNDIANMLGFSKDNNTYEMFDSLKDPRDRRGKKYELVPLMLMTLYALLCGKDDFVNIADFLKIHEKYFKKTFGITKTPSYDCLSDLFAVLDPKNFMECFINWIEELFEIKFGTSMAIDGKAVKSAREKITDGNTPYIVSAFLSELKLSIGQVKVDKKSNEITAIPNLLDMIRIKDAILTIDAMGTHHKIAKKIIEDGGHFIFKLKDNQPTLLEEVSFYFESEIGKEKGIISYTTDTEKNHGRLEKRKYYISYNTDMITNKENWGMIKCIGRVDVHRVINDVVTDESSYFICDFEIDINMFVKSLRNHWNIECSLHWRLDVILDEDHSRSRVKNSIDNLSAIRKIVFNLARLDNNFDEKVSLKRRITRYSYDFNLIEDLIFKQLPILT
jgi:predicted transposase YbfD/YdcC